MRSSQRAQFTQYLLWSSAIADQSIKLINVVCKRNEVPIGELNHSVVPHQYFLYSSRRVVIFVSQHRQRFEGGRWSNVVLLLCNECAFANYVHLRGVPGIPFLKMNLLIFHPHRRRAASRMNGSIAGQPPLSYRRVGAF